MTIRAEEALERYLYRRNGMDYGPFTIREMEHFIESGELAADSEVRRRREREWHRLGDIPHFRAYLEEKTRREMEAARERELLADQSLLRRRSRRASTLPWWIAGGVALAGVVTGILLIREPPQALAGYPLRFYREFSLAPIVPLRAMEVAPVKVARVEPPPKASGNGRRRSRPAAGVATGPGGAQLLGVELEFSYENADGSAVTRTLSPDDLQAVQRQVSSRLVRCFKAEAIRNSEFEGGSVFVYIAPSGRTQVSKVETRPPASGDLITCVRGATAGVSVAPFAGGAQVMEIPLRVAGAD
ncbi:MAG TPA: GYF domain-containing protein [Myxococcota bacterium]|nr:GYF domain-containing protein [Myxococcota bacterium]HQK52221.1 GYF domain-containing protein [Myxococcota bacterium]